jgi:hypothetical protein
MANTTELYIVLFNRNLTKLSAYADSLYRDSLAGIRFSARLSSGDRYKSHLIRGSIKCEFT